MKTPINQVKKLNTKKNTNILKIKGKVTKKHTRKYPKGYQLIFQQNIAGQKAIHKIMKGENLQIRTNLPRNTLIEI